MTKTKRLQPLNMLFIGNSFTQRNNLPGLLAELAAGRGLRVKHELISMGGASLRSHWNAGRAANAIETGSYDYVVLQEQSTLPVKNAKRMAENVRLFDALIKRAGSKTVLYMTWARQHTPDGAAGHHECLQHNRRRVRRDRGSRRPRLAEFSGQARQTRAPRP